MSLMERVMTTLNAATAAWKSYGQVDLDLIDAGYDLKWAFYTGTWRNHSEMRLQKQKDARLYRHTLLLWNIARAVVSLYAQTVYQGDLSTDGRPLPDGTRGAIPIDPQTGSAEGNAALLRACAELWSMWNWKQYMGLRPKMAAILGDCLTELVDDPEHGRVTPVLLFPGFVTDLELDLSGNIKRLAYEYPVTIRGGERFGRSYDAETYTFRKEIDQTSIRYYKNGRPHAYPEIGKQVVDNIYGFVPAVWDRHELAWNERGLGAFEGALQAVMHLNSVFTHALDYQRKQFAAPIGVKGVPSMMVSGNPARASRESRRVVLPNTEPDGTDVVGMEGDGGFETIAYDVGKTVEMLGFLRDSLVAEFPESRYAQEILEMTEVTAPGVERAMGPIVSRVIAARDNQDPQTVKLHQMPIAMIGERLKRNDYPPALLQDRAERYAVFRPYDLTSYGKGVLDFSIASRPVIPETQDERIDRAVRLQAITDPLLMLKAGVPEEEVKRIFAEREARAQAAFDREARAFNRGDDEPPADEDAGG